MSVLVLSVLSAASCVVVKFGLVAHVQGIVSTFLAATSSTLSLHALFRGLDTPPVLFFASNSRNVGDET